MDISEIMTGQVVSICEDEPVIAAARLMKQYNFGAVPVRDERGRLKGIVTDRDIVLRCVAEGKDPNECTVEDIMSKDVMYCYDDQDVEEVCENMADIRVHRLPVVNRDKRLVGVISFGDISQYARKQEVGETQQQFTRELARKAA